MSAPIKREDIRKGDRVRLSFEFTAESDYTQAADNSDDSYELIERPVVLPTEPDLYRSSTTSDGLPMIFQLSLAGDWRLVNTNSPFPIEDGLLQRYAPFTRLRDEAEVVVEVLSAVNAFEPIYKLAEQYGVTL